MADFHRIEIFLEVAKSLSFSAAARIMGISGPAASKQVMLLEEDLGVKLLHRTTRQVHLTDEGAMYFERAKLAMDELSEAAADLRDRKLEPKGALKISAPLSFGHMHLLPALSSFAKKYPEIRMDVALEDRTVDVIAEGFDVVIRIGVMTDSSLIVKPLATCPIIAVASPEYLNRYGAPLTPSDLKQHRMISFSVHGGSAEWKYREDNGKIGSIKNAVVFRANTAEMMLQAALDGVGIAILPLFTVSSFLNAKKLIRILPQVQTYPMRHIVALTPPNRYRSKKVQLFLEWLISACKAIPVYDDKKF